MAGGAQTKGNPLLPDRLFDFLVFISPSRAVHIHGYGALSELYSQRLPLAARRSIVSFARARRIHLAVPGDPHPRPCPLSLALQWSLRSSAAATGPSAAPSSRSSAWHGTMAMKSTSFASAWKTWKMPNHGLRPPRPRRPGTSSGTESWPSRARIFYNSCGGWPPTGSAAGAMRAPAGCASMSSIPRASIASMPMRLRFTSCFMSWFRQIHRLLYYRLLMNLENRVYKKPHLAIAAVSRKTASEIERHFGRKDVRVIHNGVDPAMFNPKARLSRRAEARQRFAFGENEFVVLLIGNDWNSKGLPALLQAAAACAALPLQLLVVGEDDRAAFREALERLALASRVRFEAPAADVMQFYAAADVYASPSLHDSFALPVAEAMACALPVVTSAQAGISALLHDGVDSFILRNPRDAGELARLLRRLYEDSGLRQTLGENAARTAQGLTWEKNAALTRDFLEAAMLAKKSRESS